MAQAIDPHRPLFREVGGGTVENPFVRFHNHPLIYWIPAAITKLPLEPPWIELTTKILWLQPAIDDEEREAGIEAVCREACRLVGSTVIWIRMDHRTTPTRSNGRRRSVRADPHITVYMGRDRVRYEFEGHLYVHYARGREGIPIRLADPRERRQPPGGYNPELFVAGTSTRVRFR